MQKSAPSRTADLYAKRSEGPVSAHSEYRCFQIEGRRGASAAPFNLSHWPSLWHSCREQKSSALRFASPSSATRGDSLDGRGLEARHHQHRERGRPSNHAQQALGNSALGAVRLMIASIRLMGQSKFMRSIIDATQPEQRHGLA
jgi:hypothetical protein